MAYNTTAKRSIDKNRVRKAGELQRSSSKDTVRQWGSRPVHGYQVHKREEI